MRRMLNGLAAIIILAAGSAAVAAPKVVETPEQTLARMLEGRTAGPPVDCINPRNTDTVEIIDKTAIIYRMTSGRIYVNRPAAGATALRRDQTLVTRTIGAQLCNRDSVNLIDPGSQFSAGFVSLGPFTPYSKPAK